MRGHGGSGEAKVDIAFDILHPGMERIHSTQEVAKNLIPVIRSSDTRLNKELRTLEADPVSLLGRGKTPHLTLEQIANPALRPVPLPVGVAIPSAAEEAAAKKALRILKTYQIMMADIAKQTETKLTNRVNALDPTKSQSPGLEHAAQAEALKETKEEMVAQFDRDKLKIIGSPGMPGILDELYHNPEYLAALRASGLITAADEKTLQTKHKEAVTKAYEDEIKNAPQEFKKIEDKYPELERTARINALAREIFEDEGLEFDPDDLPPGIHFGALSDEESLKLIHEALSKKIVYTLGEKGWFGTTFGQKTLAVLDGKLNMPISMVTKERAEKMFNIWRLKNPDKMTITLSIKNPDPEHKVTKSELKKLKLLAIAFAKKGVVPTLQGTSFSRDDLLEIEKALLSATKATKLRAKQDRANAQLDAALENKLNTAQADLLRQEQLVLSLKAELDEKLAIATPPLPTPVDFQNLVGRLLAAQHDLALSIDEHQGLLKQARTALHASGALSWTELNRFLEEEDINVNVMQQCLNTQQTTLNDTVTKATAKAATFTPAHIAATPALACWQDAVTAINTSHLPMHNNLRTAETAAVADRAADQASLSLLTPPPAPTRRLS